MLQQWAAADAPNPITPAQQPHSRRWLDPVLDDLFAYLTQQRDHVDQQISDNGIPRPNRNSYPKGYCREITVAMLERIQTDLKQPKSSYLQHLAQFVAGGGVIKRIWGDLRGKYFQNAIQMGDWYVDVANDTVDVNKPRVEILPLAQSGFRVIESMTHFAEVARGYWQEPLYANTVFPALAPALPIIRITANGTPKLTPDTRSLFAKNLLSGSQSAKDHIQAELLQNRVMPAEQSRQWIAALKPITNQPLLDNLCELPNQDAFNHHFAQASATTNYSEIHFQTIVAAMKAVHNINFRYTA